MGLLMDTFRNKVTTPIPYGSSNGTQSRSIFAKQDSGLATQIATMGQVGIIYSMVSKLSTSVASADWKLYQKAASGKPEDRIEVTRHPALQALQNNDFFTWQEIREAVQQHLDLSGEGYLLIEFDTFTGKMPLSVWYVRPDRMQPVQSATEYLTGWIYKGPDDEDIPLNLNEVIQIRMPNPDSYYRGLGPIKSVMTDINSSVLATQWNANFFANSAEPGGIIEVPTSLSDDDFKRLQYQWQNNHRGVSRAHRVAILENGSKWQGNSLSQKDMQYVELSTLSDDKIRQAFGYPKSMLGDTEDVNRANAETGEYVFSKHLVVPRLDRWKGALNSNYLPLFAGTENLEFDYCNPVPEDLNAANAILTTKVGAVVALVNAGFDPIESLEAVGLPEIEFTRVPTAPAPTTPPNKVEEEVKEDA